MAHQVPHLQVRNMVLRVGQHAHVSPVPLGLGVDVETAVCLRTQYLPFIIGPHEARRDGDG